MIVKQNALGILKYKDILVVNVAVVLHSVFVSLNFAVFVSENSHIRVKYWCQEKLVGNTENGKEVNINGHDHPVADLLTRIRNANTVRHDKMEVPASKMKKEIAEILKREGLIRDVEYIEDNKQGIIRIFLKYGVSNERVITGLKRLVSLDCVYMRKLTTSKVLSGLGIAIVSTSIRHNV